MTTKGWHYKREVLVCLEPIGLINITFDQSQYVKSPMLKTNQFNQDKN
jgi:hypothetical protein